jgi:hypothetical protein
LKGKENFRLAFLKIWSERMLFTKLQKEAGSMDGLGFHT